MWSTPGSTMSSAQTLQPRSGTIIAQLASEGKLSAKTPGTGWSSISPVRAADAFKSETLIATVRGDKGA
jgi:hypothetical protein